MGDKGEKINSFAIPEEDNCLQNLDKNELGQNGSTDKEDSLKGEDKGSLLGGVLNGLDLVESNGGNVTETTTPELEEEFINPPPGEMERGKSSIQSLDIQHSQLQKAACIITEIENED